MENLELIQSMLEGAMQNELANILSKRSKRN